MKTKFYFIASLFLFILFIVFTILVICVDVQPIGPNFSSVGLATINGFFRDSVGYNPILYKITELIGFSAIFTVLGFASFGLFQLVKRKSLLKVDSDIYILGGLYLLVAAVYYFFEINIINYRPVIINGEPEASFPSSHVMLICTIMGSAIMQFINRTKNKKLLFSAVTIYSVIIAITVIGRLLSGVHWFSDIIGSLILSGSLLMLYNSCILFFRRKKSV